MHATQTSYMEWPKRRNNVIILTNFITKCVLKCPLLHIKINGMKVYIKNMACESCKTVVKQELKKINISYSKIDFGEVDLNKAITAEQKQKLNTAIKKSGLELLENKNGILIEKIKINIQEFLNHPQKVNFSIFLSEKMNYDYKYLSNLFSIVQATTIEQYIIITKVEKVKELLLFEDMSLTEISHRLQYSSVAHLSAQFKKINGLNPSHYKRLRKTREVLLNS